MDLGELKFPSGDFLGATPVRSIVAAQDPVGLLLNRQESVTWTRPSDPRAGHCVGVKHTWDSSELV